MKSPTHCPSGSGTALQKRCNACKEEKSVNDFYPRKTKANADGSYKLNPMCKRCQRAYHAEHYRANKAVYVARAVRQKEDIGAFIDSLKANPCVDCGGSFPACAMDFDHLGDKKFGVSRAKRRYTNRDTILAEVAKCDLVCANCHRVRTRDRAKKAGVWTPPKLRAA